MFVSIGGRSVYLWRAVDGEGEILDALVQPRRNKAAALRLRRKLPRKQGRAPGTLVADRLGSYAAAARELGLAAAHVRARSANNRAEGSCPASTPMGQWPTSRGPAPGPPRSRRA